MGRSASWRRPTATPCGSMCATTAPGSTPSSGRSCSCPASPRRRRAADSGSRSSSASCPSTKAASTWTAPWDGARRSGSSSLRERGASVPSILIVDDETNIRATLKRALALEGYQVDDAASVAAARTLLREAYDVVLLDVSFPGESGLDLLAEIRAAAPE